MKELNRKDPATCLLRKGKLQQSDQSEAANIVYLYDTVYFKSNIRRVSKLAGFELAFFVL